MAWWVNVPALQRWLGLTHQEMAELFQVAPSTIYRWHAVSYAKPDRLYRQLLTILEDMRLRRKRKARLELVTALRFKGWQAAMLVLLAQ